MEPHPRHFIALIAAAAVLRAAADGFPIGNHRQVLPPIPGYIPVYIQHGDVPPEDPHEYAGIFQVADQNVPPRVSVTVPVFTTETLKTDEERYTTDEGSKQTTMRDVLEPVEAITDENKIDLHYEDVISGTH